MKLALKIILLMALAAELRAGQVTLAWDPNTETDLAGYKLYYGNATRAYSEVVDLGNVTTFVVTGLLPGQTYFFAVTAYNIAQAESSYSNEVFTTPLAGDVNEDGKVDALDLQRLARKILGFEELPEGVIGDLNLDSVVDVLDLQVLARLILGL